MRQVLFGILSIIDANPGINQGNVGKALGIQRANMVPLLKRLEAAGYVRRERDPQDERALAVVLTEEGRALREDALAVPPAIVERLGLPVEALQGLHDRLTTLIAAATS